jgi:[acyl-carrier-protein] S-malonyltransferase
LFRSFDFFPYKTLIRHYCMKHAFVFPGQGSQFSGMGKALHDQHETVRALFEMADELLGFAISDIMFNGTEEDLRQTKVTQPAVFIHSVAAFQAMDQAKPDMVAGHSLGEFSALVANGTLSFEDGLRLVNVRARAMQHACEQEPGTMAAVLALDDARVEAICREVEGVVVAANYNCPGQLVISGSAPAVEKACAAMKAAGARRALVLPVGGAFHSPLMKSAEVQLKAAIDNTTFHQPHCPVYQNVVATAVTAPEQIKENLIRQLTGPVRWTQSVQSMIAEGASRFTEVGPGKVLQGLVQKIDASVVVDGVS